MSNNYKRKVYRREAGCGVWMDGHFCVGDFLEDHVGTTVLLFDHPYGEPALLVYDCQGWTRLGTVVPPQKKGNEKNLSKNKRRVFKISGEFGIHLLGAFRTNPCLRDSKGKLVSFAYDNTKRPSLAFLSDSSGNPLCELRLPDFSGMRKSRIVKDRISYRALVWNGDVCLIFDTPGLEKYEHLWVFVKFESSDNVSLLHIWNAMGDYLGAFKRREE